MDEERKNKIIKQVKMLLALKFKKDDPIPAEIIPGLFIGSIGAALNQDYLVESGVTHILVAADHLNESFPETFVYKTLELLDTAESNILNLLPEAIEFIDSALRGGGKVLVHCFAGRSRSATICCGYLMQKHHLRLEQALLAVKEKRHCVMPNPGFLFQLQLFEKSLFPVDIDNLN